MRFEIGLGLMMLIVFTVFFLLFKFSFKSELLGKLERLLDQAWVNEQKNKSRVLRLVTREGYKIKQYLYVNLGKGKSWVIVNNAFEGFF